MAFIFHITKSTTWQQAQADGFYQGDTLLTEGFIHCSTREQVVRTANRFYAGQHNLILLGIEPTQVKPEIKYEGANNDELFPHIYGPLNVDAVSQVFNLEPDANNQFQFPKELLDQ